jgi:hypothetical protein
VVEVLSEGRKFGVEALVATQYPDRLAPEARAAAAGAAATYVTFRVPPASAGSVAPWVGLPPGSAAEELAALPVGLGVVRAAGAGRPGWLPVPAPEPENDEGPWEEAVAATREEFGVELAPDPASDERPVERVLLALLAAEESGRPLAPDEVVAHALRLPGAAVEPTDLARAWARLERGPECTFGADGVHLTPAGERRLGLGVASGAASESAEHRLLLLRAFCVFARRGYVIEIVRQGRFDTTLPDALFRQLGSGGAAAPRDLAHALDRARSGWAWRCFGGRDVHLEAEVSGALRPERLRRGWAKARVREAFLLFLVGDPARARRVRATLGSLGLRPDRAQVWTLGPRWTPRGPPERSARGEAVNSPPR